MERKSMASRGMAILLSAALVPTVGMPAIALADEAAPRTHEATQEGIQAADAAVPTGVTPEGPQVGAPADATQDGSQKGSTPAPAAPAQEGPQVGAATIDGASEQQAAEGEAEVNGVTYPTLNAAVEAAQSGDTVTLVDNVELTEIVIIDGKSLTLELNGKTVTNTRDIWAGDNWSLVSLRNGASLTVNGEGTMRAKNGDCYVFDIQNLSADESELVINGGTFVGNISVVYLGGKNGVPCGKETVTINGGDFSIQQLSESAGYDFMLNCLDSFYADGTFNFIVNGGTFHGFNPGDNAAEGKDTNFLGYGAVVEANEQTSPATYTVKQADRVAQIGDETFVKLEEAIAAAQSGDTVKILDDISYVRQDISGKNLTIDLNGRTLEASKFGFTIENGTLTLDDTSAEKSGMLKIVDGGATEVGVVLQEGGHFVMNGGTIDSFEYGVFANPKNKNSVTVNDGHIKGQWGIAASGNKTPGCTTITVKNGVVEGTDAGISINGSDSNGGVKIAVSGGEIKATGEKSTGMYLPGCGGETVITGGTVTGATGIELRAGSLEVSDSAIVRGTGAFSSEPNESGGTTTGVGIAVAQHTTKQPISLTVGDKAQVSGHYAFYEWNPQGNSAENLAQIELALKGGTFEATGTGAESAIHSDNFTEFVSGGTFNTPIDAKCVVPSFGPIDNGDGTFGVAKAELAFTDAVVDGVYEYDVKGGEAPELIGGDLLALVKVNVEGYEVSFEGDIDALNKAIRHADTSKSFTFEFTAKKAGSDDALDPITMTVELVDLTIADALKQLSDDIKTATNDLTSVEVSENGSDVSEGDKWVTQDAYDKFADAIAAAEQVLSADDPQRAEIDKAIEDLAAARDAFEAAKKDGTKADDQGGTGSEDNGNQDESDENDGSKDQADKPAQDESLAATSDASGIAAAAAAAAGAAALGVAAYALRRKHEE